MKKLMSVLFLSALVACGGRRGALPVLDLEAALTTGLSMPETFTLNDVLEEVEIVPIETRPDALMGTASVVHIGRRHFYVMHDNAISRVDRDGKIVGTIARQGRGPGEYLQPSVVDVNERAGTIRVFDMQGDKYITYDMDGAMIDEGSLSEKGVGVPRYTGDDWMLMRGTARGAFRLYVTDRDMNIERGLFPMDSTLTETDRVNLTQQVNVAPGRDGALVSLAATNDTLYRVTKQGMTPEAIVNRGRFRRQEEMYIIDFRNVDRNNPKTILMSGVGAFGSDHYIVNYILDNGLALQLLRRDGSVVAHSDNSEGFDNYGFGFGVPSGGEVRVSSMHVAGDVVAFVVDAVHAGLEGVAEDDNPVIVVARVR